jgi:uncharacterized membrane protein
MPTDLQLQKAPAGKKWIRFGFGILFGVALGASIGFATGNYLIGMPMGMAFGAILGALDQEAYSGKLNPKQEKIVLYLEYIFGVLLLGAILILLVVGWPK